MNIVSIESAPSKQDPLFHALSEGQKGLWFLHQIDPLSSRYNVPLTFRCGGHIRAEDIKAITAVLAKENDLMRSVFVRRGDLPVRVVKEHLMPEVTTVNANNFDYDTLALNIQKAYELPFDISQESLLRVTWYEGFEDQNILMLTFHHLIFDGASLPLLINRLNTIFANQFKSAEVKSPDFQEFISWQRKWLETDEYQQGLSFWMDHLSGELPKISWPFSLPEHDQKTIQGDVFKQTIPAQTVASMKHLAAQHKCTEYVLWLAAYFAFLGHYTSDSDVIIGTPYKGRSERVFDEIIGYFVNMMPLRCQLQHSDSFEEIIQQVKSIVYDAIFYADVPIEKLINGLAVDKKNADELLFQTAFVWTTKVGLIDPENNPMALEVLPIIHQAAEQSLTLEILTSETTVECLFKYRLNKFKAQSIEYLAESFIAFVNCLCQQPSKTLAEIPLLSVAQQKQLLQLNQQTSDLPQTDFWHKIFEEQVMLNPEKTAVICASESLTYDQLNQQANQLAHYLMKQGVGPDVLVGLFLQRSPLMLVAMLAVLKAGGAYVPIGVDYPQRRIDSIIADAKLQLVLSSIDSGRDFGDAKTIYIDTPDFLNQLESFADNNPNVPELASSHLAYVMYTSGSTGQPKGVMIEHASLVNLFHNLEGLELSDKNSSWGWVAPYVFDASVKGICAMMGGQTLHVFTDEERLDIHAIKNILEHNKLGIIDCTPSMLQMWMKMGLSPYLPNLIIGGETISRQLWRGLVEWQSTYGKKAFNVYGPTECCVDSSACRINTDVPNMGQALGHYQFYVLNENKHLVPHGAIGELYIGGRGLSRGYLNNQSLTDTCFVSNPFAEQASSKLYRTGDMVRMLPCGALAFVGRSDSQVKIRGYRIELGEIEQQLSAFELVNACAVLVSNDNTQVSERLLAFVELNSAAKKLKEAECIDQINKHLSLNLPDYMCPAHIICLHTMPLTANGKIDRKALLNEQIDQDEAGSSNPVAPINESESCLLGIWSEVLGMAEEKLSTDANFFALGGDSILSIQVVARAVEQGLSLRIKDIFDYPTISELAIQAKPAVDHKKNRKVSQQPISGDVPLLPIQYKFFNNEIDQNYYNQAVALIGSNDLSVEQLTAYVTCLYQRHDVLRVRFSNDSDTAVDPTNTAQTSHWKASHVPFSDHLIEQTVERIHLEQADFTGLTEQINAYQSALNISQGPMFKAIHCSNASNEVCVILIIHHLLVDAVSWRILIEDLRLLNAQTENNSELSLNEKTDAFQSWALFLHDYAKGESIKSQMAYWSELLHDSAADWHPVRVETECAVSHVFSQHQICLDKATTSQLLTESHVAYRTQINELLLSALLLALYDWKEITSLRISLESHGRHTLDSGLNISQTVGWFTSVFPVRLAIPDEAISDAVHSDSAGILNHVELSHLVKHIKKINRNVPENGIGYGLLKYITGCWSDHSIEEPAILFNYLGQFAQQESDAAFSFSEQSVGQSVSCKRKPTHVLNLNGAVKKGTLVFEMDYDTAVFDKKTISALGQLYIQSLTQLAEHCASESNRSFTAEDFPLCYLYSDLTQSTNKTSILNNQQLEQWQLQYHIQDIYPTTPIQQGLLFHTQFDNSAYLIQLMFDVAKNTDMSCFEQAWQNCIARHPILRTVFVAADSGEIVQLVLNQWQLPITHYHIDSASADDQLAEIEALLIKDKQRGFDLSDAPMLRMLILHIPNGNYRVIFSHHHALSDGWSLPVLFAEVKQHYSALYHQSEAHLAAAKPYKNYVEWLLSKNIETDLRFWQTQLSGTAFQPPLQQFVQSISDGADDSMNEDKLRLNSVDSFYEYEAVLTHSEWKQIETLAKSLHITVNTLLQGAWSLLLSNYTRHSEIIFGTTVSGRPAELHDAQHMLGLFINSIPVCVTIPDDSELSTWLIQLHKQQVERNEHSHVSLAEIQRFAQSSDTSLFDTLLVVENYPLDETLLNANQKGELALSNPVAFEQTHYPLTVTAQLQDTLTINLSAQKDKYSQKAVKQLAEHVKNILLAMPDALNLDVHDVAMLSDSEEFYLLETLPEQANEDSSYEFEDICLHALFERQALKVPDQLALHCIDASLSYAQLNDSANQLAHHLLLYTLPPNALIGIHLQRSSQLMIAILAVLKTGAAYVPLDPSYPKHRILHMVNDSQLSLILTESGVEFIDTDVATVVLDDAETQKQIKQHSKDTLHTDLFGLRQLAYVIYTSGSTGLPKGVMVEHQSISHHVQSISQALAIGENDRILQLASASFDTFLEQVFAGLISASGIYMTEHSLIANETFYELVREHQITITDVSPAYLGTLINESDSAVEFWNNNTLTRLVVGGDVLAQGTVKRWFDLGIHRYCRLYNAYGPTEATVTASMAEICSAEQIIHIGKPLPGRSILIADNHLKLVPFQAEGELYIGGKNLARGYLHQSELTEERFVNNPYSDELNDRLYRTGDLVRYLSDGSILYLGRVDDQVKIRGYRVELGEIEQQLSLHSAVNNCVVITVPNNQELELAAYVSCFSKLADEFPDDMSETDLLTSLTVFLESRLPAFMLPKYITILDKLPVTPNGKIDRVNLPLPKLKQASEQQLETPTGEIEIAVSVIWSEILKLPKDAIGLQSNFFELGGDSLKAVKLLTKLKSDLSLNLPIQAVFEFSSLQDLASHIAALLSITDVENRSDQETESESFEI